MQLCVALWEASAHNPLVPCCAHSCLGLQVGDSWSTLFQRGIPKRSLLEEVAWEAWTTSHLHFNGSACPNAGQAWTACTLHNRIDFACCNTWSKMTTKVTPTVVFALDEHIHLPHKSWEIQRKCKSALAETPCIPAGIPWRSTQVSSTKSPSQWSSCFPSQWTQTVHRQISTDWDRLFIGQIKATARVAVRTTPKSPDSPCDRAARIHSLAGRSHANLGNY